MAETSQQNGPPQPGAENHTCYNCGTRGHFMAYCPEPARAEPAGLKAALSAQEADSAKQLGAHHPRKGSNPRDHKFQGKRSRPVITRYAPPPSFQQSQPYPQPAGPYNYPPQGYTQGSYGYDQHPSQYQQHPPNPSEYYQTPHYGQSTAYPQYPQPSHTAVYPSGQYPSGQYPPGQYPPYASSNSQQAPPQYGHQQHPRADYALQQPWQGPQGPQYPPQQYYPDPHAQPYPPQPYSHNPPDGLPHMNNHPHSYGPEHAYADVQQTDPNWTQSQSSVANPHRRSQEPTYYNHSAQQQQIRDDQFLPTPEQKVYVPPEDEVGQSREDRKQSAFTDKSTEPDDEEAEFDLRWEYEHIFFEVDREPASQIAHPLPSPGSSDPIPVPVKHDRTIASKYANNDNLADFIASIRGSRHWREIDHDPAFAELNFQAPLVTREDLFALILQRDYGKTIKPSSPLSSEGKAELSELSSKQSGSAKNPWDPLQSPPEQALVTDIGSQTIAVNSREASRKRSWVDQGANDTRSRCNDQKSRKHSDGKRQKPNPRPQNQDSPQENREFQSGSKSSTPPPNATTLTAGLQDDIWAPQAGESPDLLDSPVTEVGHESYSKTQPDNIQEINYRIKNKRRGFNHSQQNSRKQFHYSQRKDSGYYSQRGSYSHESPDHATDPYGKPPPPPPPPPPSDKGYPKATERFANHQEGRQDAKDHRDPTSTQSANVKRSEPQRQEDDVTPRFKKRQPRVANAYERRW